MWTLKNNNIAIDSYRGNTTPKWPLTLMGTERNVSFATTATRRRDYGSLDGPLAVDSLIVLSPHHILHRTAFVGSRIMLKS